MHEKKAVLKIKGDKGYIERLQKHLHKEHPSTKGKSKVCSVYKKKKKYGERGLLDRFKMY